MENPSFSDIAIVACGTMRMELNQLQEEGFLDTEYIYYTTPGLHQDIHELERQLVQKINKARENVNKVIVVYGGKFCYVNADDPLRSMQTIIDEQGPGVVRIDATHCMGMIADDAEQEKIAAELAGGEKVWWMTPGWVRFRKLVFKGWDKGLANENFPRHTGGAIVLDGIGYLDQYMAENPEAFLDYCDWMGIPMQAYSTSLDRLKSLLTEQAKKLTD
ncbi:MAG: DUF1638 domain-containing protein [Desulfobacteraceae bacterium]|nr:DUF1638 domain-containing protein [Desulfobacteraceae bacterium]MBC2756077.1 DUF1638 domain-containing protein [Desulfobacteraceae bacterium]MBC2763765.1 DUF1638 domain-containing protein [ANME-2 cluster archaeon]